MFLAQSESERTEVLTTLLPSGVWGTWTKVKLGFRLHSSFPTGGNRNWFCDLVTHFSLQRVAFRMSNVDLHGMPAEELLLLCATAIENKNTSLAQHIICALRTMASKDGDPSERVTAYFLQALAYRAGCILEDGRESESKVHDPHKAHGMLSPTQTCNIFQSMETTDLGFWASSETSTWEPEILSL